MPATKKNAPSRGTSSAEGNDQNPTKGTIMNDATSVLDATDIEIVEQSLRPHWAPEGEWDHDEAGITYQQHMRHGRAYIYQSFRRLPLTWEPLNDADVNVRDNEGLTPVEAVELAEDLMQAFQILGGTK